jgi:hypothetical protein
MSLRIREGDEVTLGRHLNLIVNYFAELDDGQRDMTEDGK